jgi:septal ring factor EnvC (AmiA/AmiB activator)
MSSDETPKIEPKIELTVTDAPPIAPEAKPEAAEIIAPKTEPEAARPEAPKVEAIAEAPKSEAPRIGAEKIEPKIEAPTLPPAAQLAEPSTAIVTFKRPEKKAEAVAAPPSRSTRFALLAACVAIAASFGAIGGSLGIAKFGPMIAAAPPPAPVAAAKEQMADEIKALKETVAQLRASTKSLNDNFAALKATVSTTTTTANAQSTKITETLDRIEKAQAEQRKTAAAAAAATPAHLASTTQAVASPDVTGSVSPRPSAIEPNGALKNSIVQGWILRRVYDGAALIESRDGIIEVEPGSVAPGLGRVEAIKRQDGRWVVLTSRGMVVGR